MDQYQIVFWTPGHKPQADSQNMFGCSSLGMFAENRWVEPAENAAVCWQEIEGLACAGTFDKVIETSRSINFMPSLILVFLRSGLGGNVLVQRLHGIFPDIAIMGGAAAQLPEQESGEIMPDGDNASVLFATNIKFLYDSKNIHDNFIEAVACELGGPREICRIRRSDGEWMKAADYFDDIRNRLDIGLSDYESITFHERNGKNIHLSPGKDRHLNSGSNIEDLSLLVSFIERQKATDVISSYLSCENSLSIGCAGLRSLITAPFTGCHNNVGVFLFGEIICFPDGVPRFGNLMLGRMITETNDP